MTKIHGLNGEVLESEQTEQQRAEEAIKQFEAMMAELEKNRLPLAELTGDRETYLLDVERRIELIQRVVNLTYAQPSYKRSGNATQGFSSELTGVHHVSLLDNRQLALLALRAYDLIKTL
jgi:hypothetical protein